MKPFTLTIAALLLASICASAGSLPRTDEGNLLSSIHKGATTAFDENGVAVIFEAQGKGQIENMYFAGDTPHWRHPEHCVLNVYCDGQLCVSGKLYELAAMNMDFATHDDYHAMYIETPLFTKYGKRNSINLDFRIPYYKSCKVELVREEKGGTDMVWALVRATDKVHIAYGGVKVPRGAYFKAIRKPNEVVEGGQEYTFMETTKRSMMIGLNLFMHTGAPQSLEGCVRAYNTRSKTCNYLSSGLEDFFISTYYYDRGIYQGYKAGLTFLDVNNPCRMSAYRLFTDNPICFDGPTRITVRNGDRNLEDEHTDYSTSAELVGTPLSGTYGSICFYYEW